jgi:voltage-gated potassium channel
MSQAGRSGLPGPAGQVPRVRPAVTARRPVVELLLRVGVAIGLLLLVTLTVWIGRDGHQDAAGGEISFLDALYYASVSVTTTGYGDITPVSPAARLATTLIVTPARIGFLLLLVGTTIELLTTRWRDDYRRDRWRRTVKDHYVICGYGVKGRAAVRALQSDGVDRDAIVIIEPHPPAAAQASSEGLTVVQGDATRTATLLEARVEHAAVVIIATDRDDSAVLTTLTARELAPSARIVAAVREQENKHLLSQSGADEVVVSSETAGRLLGITSRHPESARVVSDLLDTAQGLMLVEREATAQEIGAGAASVEGQIPVAILRAGRIIRMDESQSRPLQHGDLVISLAGATGVPVTD